METVSTFLEGCRLAKKQAHRNLTVFPLLGTEVFDPDYLLLEQALDQDLVEIRELSHGGSVPELRLVNRGRAARADRRGRGTVRRQAEPGRQREHSGGG